MNIIDVTAKVVIGTRATNSSPSTGTASLIPPTFDSPMAQPQEHSSMLSEILWWHHSFWFSGSDPAFKDINLFLRPRAVARHRSIAPALENCHSMFAHIGVRPKVEGELHRLPIALTRWVTPRSLLLNLYS